MSKASTRGGKVNGRRRRREPEPPPTPSKPEPEPMTPVRISVSLIERVDAIKPALVPREPFIRQLLSDYLDTLEEEE